MTRWEVVIHPWLDRWAVIDLLVSPPRRHPYPFTTFQAAQAAADLRNQRQGAHT